MYYWIIQCHRYFCSDFHRFTDRGSDSLYTEIKRSLGFLKTTCDVTAMSSYLLEWTDLLQTVDSKVITWILKVLHHKEFAVCTHPVVWRSRTGRVINRKLMFAQVSRGKTITISVKELSALHKSGTNKLHKSGETNIHPVVKCIEERVGFGMPMLHLCIRLTSIYSYFFPLCNGTVVHACSSFSLREGVNLKAVPDPSLCGHSSSTSSDLTQSTPEKKSVLTEYWD